MWNSSQVNQQSAKLQTVMMQLDVSVHGSISDLKRTVLQIQNSLNGSAFELERIVQMPNSLNDHIELYSLLGRNSINPASSCFHILLFNSSSPSGHYWIKSSNGSAVRVYCDFNRQCGCDGLSTWTCVKPQPGLSQQLDIHLFPCEDMWEGTEQWKRLQFSILFHFWNDLYSCVWTHNSLSTWLT